MPRSARSSACTVSGIWGIVLLYGAPKLGHRPNLYNAPMRLRELNVGCFGGGTGLPSLLGGLKNNPWLFPHAIVTMFDSGGSSGQLRGGLAGVPARDGRRGGLAQARAA